MIELDMQIAAALQRDIDELDLVGLDESDACRKIKREFPGLQVFVAESYPIIRRADLHRITLWLDNKGLVKAAMHG